MTRRDLMGTGGTKIFQTPYGKPLILILIGILFIGAAVAATSLTIPATTILAGTAVTTSACGGTLALSGGPTPGSGTVRYNCPPSSGAFTVTTAGSDSPTFNPPSQITAVGYVSHSASSCSGFTTLTSGSSTILVTGDYDVCANYSCPTGCTISSWTITWSS